MKLLLDCDAVFDRLTRGPFPDGSPEDHVVQSHLEVCHECRQLAEALRPAVSLLHEAYDDVDLTDNALPVYFGQPSPARPLAREPASWSIGWQLVAASLLGVIIGGLTASGWFSGIGGDRQLAASAPNGSSGLATLAAMNLQEVCLPSSMALAGSVEKLRCCTDCHSSQPAARKSVDVARLQLACVACHER